jgi:hypothetical protein
VIAVGGVFGVLFGLVLAPLIFLWSLVKGARAVHADGVLCKAELVGAGDAEPAASIGKRFTGPALARFSGAMKKEGASEKDILGLALRLRDPRDAEAAPQIGDQDLVLGTFESFGSAGSDKKKVEPGDYLANQYDSVTPWKIDGIGTVRLRAVPVSARDAARAGTRRARLEADVAAGVAELSLGYHLDDGKPGPVTPFATVRLTAISPRSGCRSAAPAAARRRSGSATASAAWCTR